MSWEIEIPFADRADELDDVLATHQALRQIHDETDRAVSREILRALQSKGVKTFGGALDTLERSNPATRHHQAIAEAFWKVDAAWAAGTLGPSKTPARKRLDAMLKTEEQIQAKVKAMEL